MAARLYVCIALALGWGLWCYFQGKESCQQDAYKALEKELDAQEARAAKAVKQAVEDAVRLARVKEKGNEIKERANEVVSDDACVLDDDQLRILDEVQRQTERE